MTNPSVLCAQGTRDTFGLFGYDTSGLVLEGNEEVNRKRVSHFTFLSSLPLPLPLPLPLL
jgi:hypothetical protein